jgi:phospholipase C
MSSRREFLTGTATGGLAAATLAAFPPSIQRALAIPAFHRTGTIEDVKHVVILMQENRGLLHYFGTLRGVRGFGDRITIPLESGKSVWYQSDGAREIPPYHLDPATSSALLIPSTPHSFSDAQAAWNQGKTGFWPKFKTQYAMGYYKREDIPFQFALAEAFTLCDDYHCSITTGTDPNRIVFWSGSNFNPELRARGINCQADQSEPNNLRSWIKGTWVPDAWPQTFQYAGNPFTWDTIPDVLQRAGISWRIYQDMNDNWTGAMHGCLSFASFRNAQPGTPIYVNGMTGGPDFLDRLANDVLEDKLPEVSWILTTRSNSEHPGGPSSPTHGGDFTAKVLNALTANPKVWSRTVFLLTFDENDGLFDHLPAPAVPSYDIDGNLMGKATLPLAGEYFDSTGGTFLNIEDTISGAIRPWGMGPRVPLYVVSPWSKGGWVNSQVFDHTSVAMFLEKRFGIKMNTISPWHRAVSGDLTTAFDFASPNDPRFPTLPDQSYWSASDAQQRLLPSPIAPAAPQPLVQEIGVRYSRALPYELHTSAHVDVATSVVTLVFANTGRAGAVFHVYDKHHLDRIPRRYTVEPGKALDDAWVVATDDGGSYDLSVFGPNGFHRHFKGDLDQRWARNPPSPEIEVIYDAFGGSLRLRLRNDGRGTVRFTVKSNKVYGPLFAFAGRGSGFGMVPLPPSGGPGFGSGPGNTWNVTVGAGKPVELSFKLETTGRWYDFVVTSDTDSSFYRRLAGRMETGRPATSDPAMGLADRF